MKREKSINYKGYIWFCLSSDSSIERFQIQDVNTKQHRNVLELSWGNYKVKILLMDETGIYSYVNLKGIFIFLFFNWW